MADRESSFRIVFDGDASDLGSVLASLKKSVRSTVTDLEQTTGRVELFKTTKQSVEDTSKALDRLRGTAAEFRLQIAGIQGDGGKVGKELTDSLKAVEKQIAATSKEYNRQSDALAKLEKQLTAAGVDVGRLADEEKRLAQAAAAAAVEQKELAARQALGIRSTAEAREAVARLNAAFSTLRDSGKLSFGELSAAQAALRTRTAELGREYGTLGSAFASVRTATVGIVASFAAVTAAIASSVAQANRFGDAMGKLQTVTSATGPRLEALADGARAIGREFGVEASKSIEALYDVLRQGIPADNALAVLESAALASQSAFIDLGTAVKLSTSLVNAFGVPAADLTKVLDKLYVAGRNGGATLGELADNLGELAPIARAAGVPLDSIIAAVTTLKRSGLDAPSAISALSKAIAQLSAPTTQVAQRMREAGISATDFFGIVQEIAAKRLSLDQLRDLVDAKTLKSLAALTGNFEGLNAELGRLGQSAGALRQANDEIDKTSTDRIEKLRAAVSNLATAFGESLATRVSDLIARVTELINWFNGLSKSTQQTTFTVAALGGAIVAGTIAIKAMSTPINVLASLLPGLGVGFAKFTGGIAAAGVAMRAFGIAAAALVAYELGKWAYDSFEGFRRLVDVLAGPFNATINTLVAATKALGNLFTLDFQGLRDTEAQWRANARVIQQDFANALSGATERMRQARAEQARLSEELAKANETARSAADQIRQGLAGAAGAVDAQMTAAANAIDNILGRLDALAASLQQRGQAVANAAQQALANIQAEADARIGALDKSQAAEIASAQARVAIEQDTARQKLDAINRFADQAKVALEAELAARIEIAKRQPEQLAKIEQEIANRKRDTLQQIVAAYRAHIQTLGQLEEAHLAKVREVQEKRRLLNASIEDKIRALLRETLTETEKYADRVLEIDQLLAKAREQAMRGNLTSAEELASKALGLVDQIGRAVVDGGKEAVTAYQAQQIAVERYQAAAQILNGILDKREKNEAEAAKVATDGLADAKQALEGYNRELATAGEAAAKGLALGIRIDDDAVSDALAQLDAKLAQQEALLPVKLELDEAMAEVDRLKVALSEGLTDSAGRLAEALREKLGGITALAPQFAREIGEAASSLDKVVGAIASINATKLRIETNATEVERALQELDGRQMRATLTVDVKLTGDKLPAGVDLPIGANRGGLIPDRVRAAFRMATTPIAHFASGGPVFAGKKVPGAGSRDTYPATLEGGSFVVRKAASAYYGDGIMGLLARGLGLRRGFAAGGPVSPLLGGPAAGSPLLGNAPRGSMLANLGGGGPLWEIIGHAFKVFQPLIDGAKTLPRSSNGQNLADYLVAVLDLIRNATDVQAAGTLLDGVESIAGNLMAAIEQAHRMNVPIVMGALAPNEEGGEFKSASASKLYDGLVEAMRAGRGFARGGPAGTDTVPAMLTPGEWVIRREAVQRFGAGLFAAINSMKVPRDALANLVPAVPAPRPLYFAGGGQVPGGVPASSRTTTTAGGTYTVNINASAEDLFSTENVRRYLIPVLRDYERRSSGR